MEVGNLFLEALSERGLHGGSYSTVQHQNNTRQCTRYCLDCSPLCSPSSPGPEASRQKHNRGKSSPAHNSKPQHIFVPDRRHTITRPFHVKNESRPSSITKTNAKSTSDAAFSAKHKLNDSHDRCRMSHPTLRTTTCMSLNSKARAVCQSMTAHAFRMPRQALILRRHCFSKQPWHRLSNRLCTSTLPCHAGLGAEA